jgi:hypothetical protein
MKRKLYEVLVPFTVILLVGIGYVSALNALAEIV